jgi:hypothetical protein
MIMVIRNNLRWLCVCVISQEENSYTAAVLLDQHFTGGGGLEIFWLCFCVSISEDDELMMIRNITG